jgi:hypothetical protein
VPYRPDARQTKHHPFGRRAFPYGPSTVSRRFCPTCIRPDVSAARPDASLYSTSSRFFPSSNKGKIKPTVRNMWYPVRTRVSTRQESQFKYTRPDVRQPWSERAFIKEGNYRFDFNRPDDYLSWSGHAHISYGNCVLKISCPDVHPPWSERAKP